MKLKIRNKIIIANIIIAIIALVSFLLLNLLNIPLLIEIIFVFIFVYLASRIISYKITSPIGIISRDLLEISSGDFSKRLTIESNDEFMVLAEAINNLTQKIKEHMVELDRLVKVRSQFLANVSHELRTPIFSVQAYIETLVDGAINDPKVNKLYLEKAMNQVERLNNLLNDLIDISRIESGEMKLSYRYFNVIDFLRSVAESCLVLAKSKGINLEYPSEDPSTQLQVIGDKERLTQVLNNLLNNAVKYNPGGTNVTLNYSKENGHVKILVKDNGTGIGDEHLKRIFERFYRIDKERSRESGGTGLGLAIVKHIVEAHGSKIEVQSKLGEGTTFWFYLKT